MGLFRFGLCLVGSKGSKFNKPRPNPECRTGPISEPSVALWVRLGLNGLGQVNSWVNWTNLQPYRCGSYDGRHGKLAITL